MASKPKDLELWQRVARTAKPLQGRDRHASYRPGGLAEGEGAKEARAEKPFPNGRAVPSKAHLPLPARKAEDVLAKRQPCLAHGQIAGIDRRTAERLKRGRLPVEARLDLHGLTQAEAHRALNAFIVAGCDAGRRCVLVITGKGLQREDGGVLRGKVPLWLNQPPNRGRVLAYDYAQPRDGGTGALYVLLRRKR